MVNRYLFITGKVLQVGKLIKNVHFPEPCTNYKKATIG